MVALTYIVFKKIEINVFVAIFFLIFCMWIEQYINCYLYILLALTDSSVKTAHIIFDK